MRVLFLLIGLLCTGQASAKDMGGRFGLGADRSLGFFGAQDATFRDGEVFPGASSQVLKLPGLSVVYRASKIFGIQLIFSTEVANGEIDTGPVSVSTTVTQVGIALRGQIGVGISKEVNLDAIIGVTYVNTAAGTDVVGTDFTASNIAIELGIRPEWFITEHLSIHTQVGVAISILDSEFGGVDTGGGVHVNLFGPADLLGNAGFTFWF